MTSIQVQFHSNNSAAYSLFRMASSICTYICCISETGQTVLEFRVRYIY